MASMMKSSVTSRKYPSSGVTEGSNLFAANVE